MTYEITSANAGVYVKNHKGKVISVIPPGGLIRYKDTPGDYPAGLLEGCLEAGWEIRNGKKVPLSVGGVTPTCRLARRMDHDVDQNEILVQEKDQNGEWQDREILGYEKWIDIKILPEHRFRGCC